MKASEPKALAGLSVLGSCHVQECCPCAFACQLSDRDAAAMVMAKVGLASGLCCPPYRGVQGT